MQRSWSGTSSTDAGVGSGGVGDDDATGADGTVNTASIKAQLLGLMPSSPTAPVGTMAGTGSGDGVAASPSAPVAVNANLFSLTAVTTRVLAGEERPPHDDMAESVTSNVSDAPVVPWSIKNVLRNRLTSVAAAVKSPKGGKAGQPGAFAFK